MAGSLPEIYQRQFKGVNQRASRDTIQDTEFYWLENLQPLGDGKLVPVLAAGTQAVLSAPLESGAPTFTINFSTGNVDYVFAVWQNSGNGYVGPIGGTLTKIFTNTLTSGQTSATPWGNQGLLIVDPTGYWDWNVTAPATLTSLSGGVQAITNLTYPTSGAHVLTTVDSTSLMRLYIGTSGTPATAIVGFIATKGVISAGGTGYLVGDVLSVSGGAFTTAAQVQVTSVSSGAVTGLSIINTGLYTVTATDGVGFSNPLPSTIPTPLAGGSGSGATVTMGFRATTITIVSGGSGYSATSGAIQVFVGGLWQGVHATFNVTPAGNTSGIAIAAYAGRAWIASGRTISVTDALSYNSFANSGTSFTINDEWLHNNITALAATNNYLYIFGDASVDLLSNVTVQSGILNFSRVNINSALGTKSPNSIFAFDRSLAFADPSGIYLLSGATAEQISRDITDVLRNVNFSAAIFGGQVVINSKLSAAFLLTITDKFSYAHAGQTRTLLLIFFQGEWWVATPGPGSWSGMVSIPVAGAQTLYAWSGNALYQLFAGPAQGFEARTKLWDAGAPLEEKQALRVGAAITATGGATPNIALYVDNEFTSLQTNAFEQFGALTWTNNAGGPITWTNNSGGALVWSLTPSGYVLDAVDSEAGGCQFLGLTLVSSGPSYVAQVLAFAMRMKSDRPVID